MDPFPRTNLMRHRALVPMALILAVACASDESTAPKPLTLTGTWQQSAHLVDGVNGDSHAHIGTFALVQSGENFDGSGEQTGLCSTATTHYTGPLSDETPFAISGGTIIGRSVAFQRDICQYSGTFVAGRNDRITGTATCAFSSNGKTYHFSGGWQADRLH